MQSEVWKLKQYPWVRLQGVSNQGVPDSHSYYLNIISTRRKTLIFLNEKAELHKRSAQMLSPLGLPGPLGPAKAGSGALSHGTCHAEPGPSVCLSVSLPRL